jgi:hypothetical protein
MRAIALVAAAFYEVHTRVGRVGGIKSQFKMATAARANI